MVSQLDFNVEHLLNPKVLIVRDASWYNPSIVVKDARLIIQYPGSDKYVTIPVSKSFSYTINSNTLGLTNVSKSSLLTELPDGLWTINYSICPNDKLFIEKCFLRNTKQEVRYSNAYCALTTEKCEHKQYMEELRKLREIKMMMDAAVYLADCCKYEQAIELYDRVDVLLDAFESNCNCYG